EQRASWAARGGNFVGGLLPAIAATGVGSVLGVPEAGLFVGAAQQGMQAAGATFDDAIAHGGGEEDAAGRAGLLGRGGGGRRAGGDVARCRVGGCSRPWVGGARV